MTTQLAEETREQLTDFIQRHGLKEALVLLRDIAHEADSNNPKFGWLNDAALLSEIIPHIAN